MHPDDIWNTGLIAIVVGLIVARLWNVVQFRHIYLDEPTLAISLRPSGFALLPGLIAALIGGYANLLRRALDPAPVAASFAVGALAAGAALNMGGYLSGSIVGIPSDLPWALPHFGELLHPVAIYRALGLLTALILIWWWDDGRRPWRTTLLAILAYCLVHLTADAFVADPALLDQFRLTQVVALGVGIGSLLLLAREQRLWRETAQMPLAEPDVST
jgi:prolipoprotein diacylglyceryltransferase